MNNKKTIRFEGQSPLEYVSNNLIAGEERKNKVYRFNDTTVDKVIEIASLRAGINHGILTYEGNNLFRMGTESFPLAHNEHSRVIHGVSEHNALYCIYNNCRNVLHIDPFFSAEGPLFGLDDEQKLQLVIRTKYVPGKSLNKLVAKNKISYQDTAIITIAVLDALQDLERCSIIHRDVTPANIIYDPEKKAATLIDFGIAFSTKELESTFIPPHFKLLLSERQEHFKERIVGTPAYFSPEHHHEYITPKADLFSLGLTLHTLITKENISQKRDNQRQIILFSLAYTNNVERKELMKDIYAETENDKRFQRQFLPGIESILDENPYQRNIAFLRECAQNFLQRNPTKESESWKKRTRRWLRF